jgi:hypothetical protein
MYGLETLITIKSYPRDINSRLPKLKSAEYVGPEHIYKIVNIREDHPGYWVVNPAWGHEGQLWIVEDDIDTILYES